MMIQQGIFVTLFSLAVAAETSSAPRIPYDGKNLHLSSQYRLQGQDFHDRHTSSSQPVEKKETSFLDQEEVNDDVHRHQRHHLYPDDKYRHYKFLNTRTKTTTTTVPEKDHSDKETQEKVHDTINIHDRQEQPYQWVHSGTSNIKKHTPNIHHQTISLDDDFGFTKALNAHETTAKSMSTKKNSEKNGFADSLHMFAIWSLDNLFWLVPFVAHSYYNALYFFVTYQVLVAASCVIGSVQGVTFEQAQSLNMVWGGMGALVCWLLVCVFYWRSRQSASGKKVGTSSSSVDEESGLNTPLLPQKAHKPEQNLSMPVAKPTALLTISMTVLAGVDDLFFVPVILDKTILSWKQICLGSFVAVLLWTCFAVVMARLLHRFMSAIPLYKVLFFYAAVMTGHSQWDLFSSHADELKMLSHEVKP
ncbi:expressed unknown protein [Seminavis robusta]|uniref:Uncharacterized protein n=1 Tax=Seminavis robusta TaxID=568900 RepID=A0A9N8H934_9STRA|nr:expressed unknown protein [Seminavis robusta]|eukprot:Sro178_g077990.1 n/a (418) ;mRNA; r:7898-9151